ncbi:MAG: nickel-dependent lactate racemase [bacterium]|jgi:nickel-dependent lactate racemase
MVKIDIPYGRGSMPVEIPTDKVVAVLESGTHSFRPAADEATLVAQALAAPIGAPPLRELARGNNKVVIISSDHTRPVPSRITLPPLLDEIRSGNPEAEITILIATGLHRSPTEDELIDRYGPEVVRKERIVAHNAFDDKSLVAIGKLPSGGQCLVNRLAVEADLVVAEGFIEPHFFAGFSGGRKSILPGIVGHETIVTNHSAGFIDHPRAQAGILHDNPIHIDQIWAARQVKLAFILNVIFNPGQDIIAAFAGDMEKAHLAGCKFLAGLAQVAAAPADIVITSNGGYPLDQNLYQAVKGMYTANRTIKPGGTIIIAASCLDGVGGDVFYEYMAKAESPAAVLADIRQIPPEKTILDQWQIQILAKILLENQVIVVTDGIKPHVLRDMFMEHAASLDQALERAFTHQGKEAQVTVVPDGVAVIVA